MLKKLTTGETVSKKVRDRGDEEEWNESADFGLE